MLKSNTKKIALVLIIVLMSVLLSVPASALTVGGGATVEGYQAFVIGGGLETELMQIRELNEYKINFAFRALEFPYYSSTVQTVANFLFKPSFNDYGTLEFTYTLSNNNGLLNADSSAWQQVGLFDGATGKKLANATVSGTELKFSYTGHIPSRFYVVGYYYFTVPETSQDAIISSYAFKFTPIDKGSQDIIDNQNENTDKIIDNQNELYDKEHNEITESGDKATEAVDQIPDQSQGFISALTNFSSAMMTEDTSCSITFPALKIPSIAGLPEYTVSEARDVNFEEAVDLMPEGIMTLIRALTTIALIVYCFKELYDTISEALTRKKANADG